MVVVCVVCWLLRVMCWLVCVVRCMLCCMMWVGRCELLSDVEWLMADG